MFYVIFFKYFAKRRPIVIPALCSPPVFMFPQIVRLRHFSAFPHQSAYREASERYPQVNATISLLCRTPSRSSGPHEAILITTIALRLLTTTRSPNTYCSSLGQPTRAKR